MYKNLKNVLRPHIFDLDISWIGKKTFEKKTVDHEVTDIHPKSTTWRIIF